MWSAAVPEHQVAGPDRVVLRDRPASVAATLPFSSGTHSQYYADGNGGHSRKRVEVPEVRLIRQPSQRWVGRDPAAQLRRPLADLREGVIAPSQCPDKARERDPASPMRCDGFMKTPWATTLELFLRREQCLDSWATETP